MSHEEGINHICELYFKRNRQVTIEASRNHLSLKPRSTCKPNMRLRTLMHNTYSNNPIQSNSHNLWHHNIPHLNSYCPCQGIYYFALSHMALPKFL